MGKSKKQNEPSNRPSPFYRLRLKKKFNKKDNRTETTTDSHPRYLKNLLGRTSDSFTRPS